MQGARRVRRISGLLFLGLFCIAQICQAAHQSFIEHHLCPADGELSHGERAGECSSPAGAVAAADQPGPRIDSAGEEGAHAEHCALLLASEQRKVRLDDARSALPPLEVVLVLALPPSERPGAAALVYTYAPKQSPPRAE